jgi:glycosyltransferase involved in cell wall biosynthesis
LECPSSPTAVNNVKKELSGAAGRRPKVLFVIGSFSQGGSERWLYETSRALRTRGWEVEVLTTRSVDPGQFYYKRLRSLLFPIHRRLPTLRFYARLFPGLYETVLGRRLIDFMNRLRLTLALGDFLAGYDLVSIVQIENYIQLQSYLPSDAPIVIHLMSNAFQYERSPYEICASGRRYRFVLMDPAQRQDLDGTPCESAETLYLPLALDFSEREPVSIARPARMPVRIATFIRLSSERPFDPLLYSFQSAARQVDATLYVYGGGDTSRARRTVKLLGIEDRVTFRGHASDIRKAIVEDGISMVWMTCHDRALGYASIEVAALRVPMLFWNLGREEPGRLAEATGGAVKAFPTVKEFAGHAAKLLSAPDGLKEEAARLFEYVRRVHDIERVADATDEYYRKVMAEYRA